MRSHVRYVDPGWVKVSAVGLGTWQFGSREWGYGADYAERGAFDMVGINLIDLAEIYGFGQSEESWPGQSPGVGRRRL